METEIKGGAGLERVTSYLQVLFVCFLNIQGLFLGTVSDLAKFHSNYSGKRKQQTKNTLMWVGKKKKKKFKNVVLVGEKTKGLCKTHPSAFDV